MPKNAERAKALKARGKLPQPVRQDLSGIESRLDGLAESLKASRATPRQTQVISVEAHQDEVLDTIAGIKEFLTDLRHIIENLDENVCARIEALPDYSEKFLMLEAAISGPKQHVPWRLDVKRMGGPTSPIKAVEATPVNN